MPLHGMPWNRKIGRGFYVNPDRPVGTQKI